MYRRAEAYKEARRFYPAGSDHLMDGWLMGQMVLEVGEETAREIASFWRTEAKRRYVDPYNIAVMYASLGDENTAFEYLRRSVRERSASVFFLAVEPWFLPIRQRPDYRDLLRAMNLQ